MAWIIQLN